MKKSKLIITFLIPCLFITVLSLGLSTPSEPHPANAMWIEPSTIQFYTNTTSVGYRFNVTVWINLTSNPTGVCGGWQFKLIYDPTYLNATRAGYTGGTPYAPGTTPGKSEFFNNVSTLPLTPYFGPDYVQVGETWMGVGDMRHVPGYGSLAWVEFEIIAEPSPGEEITVTLDISSGHHPPISDTYALDGNGDEIPLTVYDATYKFTSSAAPPSPPPAGATIYVDPPEIIDPTMRPSSTFEINITILNVTDLKICEFNMSYNPDIIGWMNVGTYKVENETPTVRMILDDEAGYIWMKLTYPTSVNALTPTPIAKIIFHVEAYGATPLDLHDTQLLNSENQPIEHTAEDGFFATIIRDIAIIDITPHENWVYCGWSLNISVTVKNKGDVNETFTVALYYDNTLIGNLTVTDLPPNNETTIIFEWDTQNVTPCQNYTIRAEASKVPYETNLADNQLTDGKVKIRILGDVNADNKVDVKDVYETSKAFGSYPGHPRWNRYADLDRNLKVDVKDIFIVAKNFGQECPTYP